MAHIQVALYQYAGVFLAGRGYRDRVCVADAESRGTSSTEGELSISHHETDLIKLGTIRKSVRRRDELHAFVVDRLAPLVEPMRLHVERYSVVVNIYVLDSEVERYVHVESVVSERVYIPSTEYISVVSTEILGHIAAVIPVCVCHPVCAGRMDGSDPWESTKDYTNVCTLEYVEREVSDWHVVSSYLARLQAWVDPRSPRPLRPSGWYPYPERAGLLRLGDARGDQVDRDAVVALRGAAARPPYRPVDQRARREAVARPHRGRRAVEQAAAVKLRRRRDARHVIGVPVQLALHGEPVLVRRRVARRMDRQCAHTRDERLDLRERRVGRAYQRERVLRAASGRVVPQRVAAKVEICGVLGDGRARRTVYMTGGERRRLQVVDAVERSVVDAHSV